MIQNKTAAAVDSFDHALPRYYLEWALLPFIIGLMTLSHIEGWSAIMVLYGMSLAILFFINFLYLKLKLQPEVIIHLAWIAWAVIGVFNAIDLALFWRGLTIIIQMEVLIFIVAGISALYRNMSLVVLAIAIGGLIVALSGYYTGEAEFADEVASRTQVEGLTGNPNSFAYHLLFVIFAMFYFWRNKSSFWQRGLIGAIVAISVIGIIYSGSRKGFLGVLAFVLCWFLFCHGKNVFKKPVSTLAILLISLVGIYHTTGLVLSSTYLGERFEDAREHGNSLRVRLYKEGWEMIQEKPIQGVGLNNFRALSATRMHSHSDYIEVAANTGIVGFVLYFSIYIVLWRRLTRIRAMTDEPELLYISGLLKAAIITILILAFGRPNIDSKLTWVFLAGAIGYSWSIERALSKRLHGRDESEGFLRREIRRETSGTTWPELNFTAKGD
jgi:O-antigen ligase